MLKRIQTSRFFNLGTQRALYEKVEGYVDKEVSISEHVENVRESTSAPMMVRMDLGQNPDGCDPELMKYVIENSSMGSAARNIHNYPDVSLLKLRNEIAKLHGVRPDWVILSAGLDQMLAMISSAFFELNDRYLVTAPSFFLFNEYSMRMGAIPITIFLREENSFDWTEDTIREYEAAVDKLHPKILWIANPNNPTGRVIPQEMLGRIIRIAKENYVFVVVDEAYGEYTDSYRGIRSASHFLSDYHNLIVLRTFSKAYGMAGMRIAYAITGEVDIAKALTIHRPYYPITGLSLLTAREALNRISYLETVRTRVRQRGEWLKDRFSRIGGIHFIESATGIMMIKRDGWSAERFRTALAAKGIFAAQVPGEHAAASEYVRITIGAEKENEYFIRVLECIQS